MSQPGSFRIALKEAKRWADFYSIISIVLVVALSIAAWLLANSSGADLETKLEMQIMMVAIVLVVCIWQAAACAVASLRASQHDDQSHNPESDGQKRTT